MAVRRPPARAQRGESARAAAPTSCSASAPPTLLAGRLRLRRAPLDEPDRADDVERELQELGLPVLRRLDGEARGGQELGEGHGRLAVLALLVVVEVLPRDGLAGERREEQDEEHQRQRVVAHKPPPRRAAHRPAIPRAMK